MPKKPDWYRQFEGIVERLSNLPPDQELIRQSIEGIFGVKRTEARRIFVIAGGEGRFIKVSALLKYVESRREDAGAQRKRKNRLAHTIATEKCLAPARTAAFRLPKLPSVGDIHPDVRFESGVLFVPYGGFEDLVAKMLTLAKAMQFDTEKFREMAEHGLAGMPERVAG